MMTNVPLLAVTAAVGHRCLFNWQEPLGQDSSFLNWSSWSDDTKIKVLLGAAFLVLLCCLGACCYFCHRNKDAVSSSPSWHQQEEAPAVAEVPTADLDSMLGDVELTQAGVEWVLANLELLAPTEDVEMAPTVDVEIAPAPEPAPTLKCTFSKLEGWAEGTCSVCLSELVDGEKVRVLTACMHCFHATCVEKWLRENATCPLCRAPTMAVLARGRRRRRRVDPNLSLA